MLNDKNKIDFSIVSHIYQKTSLVQNSASESLIQLLKITGKENILDLGCGPGHITQKLYDLTSGKVTGVDSSEGMIRQAQEFNKDNNIRFLVKNVENMDFHEEFDIIFCNSTLQWWKNPSLCIQCCYQALRNQGRIGIQAPATQNYGLNFIHAIQAVETDPKTKDSFSHFKNPWFFLETAQDYKILFEQEGLRVPLAKIETVRSFHTPEEVYKIFESGAAVGYLNPVCYDISLTDSYLQAFRDIVRATFYKQANDKGKVELVFNRIYLLAIKE